ncbi:nicotinamide-nucleotide amidohydrolase family protein [Fulvivirgaceae bacterium PWU5]|uniref:Nicotinamide-nucleotide amidohydrolase family protein n=1 Tax=Dawidia cretensis TaxID=2782350 RepID=A0AAP2GPG5_9BACT|nr:nicotinamide-nucleotide amidohydrolase family protein [Dawidia cretensis]MBT1708194.1 nicotinamide-nucleotide amidohydrolase family protein [Dawidia cretensis]
MHKLADISDIKQYMVAHEETLAIAESVTAGQLQAAISLADGASLFFQGGLTAYNIGQKARLLQVEPIHALACNCVSDRVSAQMARHVSTLFSSDWGIAITGYAAPLPECGIEETLFAFYAVAYNGEIVLEKKIETTKEGIYNVQRYYVAQILEDFGNYLSTRRRD